MASLSITRIEKSTGLGRITVRRALRALEQARLLRTIERGTSATRPSRYRIRPVAPQSPTGKPP
jgi:DNA-binding GntR family transcriptional regulator